MFELNNYDDGRFYLRIETRKSVLEVVLRFISSHHKITIFVKKFLHFIVISQLRDQSEQRGIHPSCSRLTAFQKIQENYLVDC